MNLGLRNEVANVISTKVMVKCIIYEQEPNRMHCDFNASYPPWMQSFAETIPESPIYWDAQDTNMHYLAESCTPGTLSILRDMRALTSWLLGTSQATYVHHASTWHNGGFDLAPDSVDPAEIEQRCFSRPAINTAQDITEKDWIYEALRLASLVYATALHQKCPFSIAHSMAAARLGTTSVARLIVRAVHMTDSTYLWRDLSGCFFWLSLVGAASAAGRHAQYLRSIQTPADILCRKMLSMSSMRGLQMLAGEHSQMVHISCRNILDVQNILADAWKARSQQNSLPLGPLGTGMAAYTPQAEAFIDTLKTCHQHEFPASALNDAPALESSLLHVP